MNTDLAVQEPQHELAERSVAGVLEQRNKIRQLMSDVMELDVDYGVIPGTGSKPTLLKPGAEKLAVTFRLAPDPAETKEIWHEDGHLTVVAMVRLTHITSGNFVAGGRAICSTRETKYAYRTSKQVCPACNLETIIKGKKEYGGGWVCFKKIGGCGAKYDDGDQAIESQTVGKVDNPDIADSYNTVEKMACKRALVAAVLNGTAASDIFTQDIEEFSQTARPWWEAFAIEFGDGEFLDAINKVLAKHEYPAVESLLNVDKPKPSTLAEILAAARKAKDAADGVVDAEVVEEPADSVSGGSANQGSEAGPLDGKSSASDSSTASDPETVQDSEPTVPASPRPAAQDEGEEPVGSAKAPAGSDPLKGVQQRAMERAHKTKDEDSLLPYRGCESGLHFGPEDQCPDCGWNPMQNPCPICGEECLPWTADKKGAPKWRCTNTDCTGDDGKPWVSWHNDPWKPGGQIETEYDQEPAAESTSHEREAEPGEAAVTADDPAPSQPALDGVASPEPAASSSKPRTRRKKEQPK